MLKKVATRQLAIISRDADHYADIIGAMSLPGLHIVATKTDTKNLSAADCEIILGDPDLIAPVLNDFTRLRWLQSTWAGNYPLIETGRTNYLLTGVKGIFGEAIREYIGAYLLYFSRAMDDFHPRVGAPGRAKPTSWNPPIIDTLVGKTVGVLGAGSIGSSVAPLAQCFSFRLLGLNRTGRHRDGFAKVYALHDLHEFVAQLDYLVCLLPDTPATRRIIDRELLTRVRPECVLINAGRGNNIDEDALLDALDQNRLRAAVLDVFTSEPLADGHIFWHHPKIWVTQHTAAISAPSRVAGVFAANFARWHASEPLEFVIDFDRGY